MLELDNSFYLSTLLPPYITSWTSDDTMKLRVVDELLRYQNLSAEELQKKMERKVYIHPVNSYWINYCMVDLNLTEEEEKVFANVLSVDYADRESVEEMADILYGKMDECNERLFRFFNCLFAVDGYGKSFNFKHYVDHLSISAQFPKCHGRPILNASCSSFELHVLAVRDLYWNNDHLQWNYELEPVSPVKVHEIILKAYQFPEENLAMIRGLQSKSDLVKYYLYQVGDFARVKRDILKPKIEAEMKEVVIPE